MKMIPKNELIIMLQQGLNDTEIISNDMINNIFKIYGDDYFKSDMGRFAKWELTTENENRKNFLLKVNANGDSN